MVHLFHLRDTSTLSEKPVSFTIKVHQTLMTSQHLQAAVHLSMPGWLRELSAWSPCFRPCPPCICIQHTSSRHPKTGMQSCHSSVKPWDASIGRHVKVSSVLMSKGSQYHDVHSCDFSASSPSVLPPFLSPSSTSLLRSGGTWTLYFRTCNWLLSYSVSRTLCL